MTLTNLPLQFLLIFHKAAAGELQEDSGLMALAKLSEIDVALEGVKGAKDFFEAKVGASFLRGTVPVSLLPAQRAPSQQSAHQDEGNGARLST